jgi:diacylglycerol kinase family enzyme
VEHVDPLDLLRRAGLRVTDVLPIAQLTALGAARLVSRWRETGARAVIVAGGDGSAGAVATIADQADLPLGILPLGTANDIARALALPEDPTAAARLIARCLRDGQERAIDAGELVAGSVGDGATGGHFLHALTLGLNVEFARLATDVGQRQRWGKLTYAASAIESLSHFTPVPVTLTIAGMEGQPEDVTQTVTASVALLAAINLPVFGGRLELRLPAVREDDRLLYFLLIEALVRPDLGIVTAALNGLLAALVGGADAAWRPGETAPPGGRWFRARSVAIATPAPVEITLDGELRGHTPAIARIAARRVRVLAPPAYATLKEDSTKTTTDVGDRPSGLKADEPPR